MAQHRFPRFALATTLIVALAGCSGDDGKNGAPGTSCTIDHNEDTGVATITCDDGTSTEITNGADGVNGEDGAACTVTENEDGSKTISCEDGTEVTVTDGVAGDDGLSCTVEDNGDGTQTITCEDGTVATVTDGTDGGSCTVTDNGDGTRTIECEDGSTVTIEDGEAGEAGGNVEISNFHGMNALLTQGEFAEGKYFVDVVITDATADAGGVVTVDFTVADRADGTPVLNLAAASASIAKLVPASGDESFNKWVSYIYRQQTIVAGSWPNPEGTSAWQATSENAGTLTNNLDGSYTYVLATNLTTANVGGTAIAYERGLTHRVSIMMGGHAGATGNANFDFVPDGAALTETRSIVETETCQNCHGWEFHGHGGNRLTTDNCVTCHNPGNLDPNSGETIDFKVMIHKIHMGGELPGIAGADGQVFDDPATLGVDESADNGEYAIWGNRDSLNEWSAVGFPAVIENCTTCHQGAGADVENWRQTPSREACGSCHADVDFAAGTGHEGGPMDNDDDCTTCHRAEGGGLGKSVTEAHNWIGNDPRMDPEFDVALSMTAPANGTHYVDGEAPVISVVLTNRATGAVLDHTTIAEDATGEGCVLVDANNDGDWDTCPQGDGYFRTANLTVHGPRALRVPVLTTAGRAQILSATTGPFNLSAANASLILKVDGGVAVHSTDQAGGDVMVSGNISVPVSGGTFVSLASATTDEIVAWLNANGGFNKRAIAFNQAGRVGIRSRNLGWMHSIQLSASEVATQVFGGDLVAKTPSGSYAANNVSSRTNPANNDPKVTRNAGSLTYALDPVDDLEPGTYVVRVEFADAGNIQGVSGSSRVSSTALFRFQVGTADEEPFIARNCDTCHESPDGVGLGIHTNKYFTDDAMDTCSNCHDYLPQYANSIDPSTGQPRSGYGAIGWTGAKSMSRRIHGVHFGSELNYPNATVDHADAPAGRNWDIGFPQDVRNCEVCHTEETSGSWLTNPNRLACSGCHDSDAATAHMRMQTLDPTPADPWSGDEEEACAVCHAVP